MQQCGVRFCYEELKFLFRILTYLVSISAILLLCVLAKKIHSMGCRTGNKFWISLHKYRVSFDRPIEFTERLPTHQVLLDMFNDLNNTSTPIR